MAWIPNSVRDAVQSQETRISSLEGKILGATGMFSALMPIMAALVSVALIGGAIAAVGAIVNDRVKGQVEEQIGDVAVALTASASQATQVASERGKLLAVATEVPGERAEFQVAATQAAVAVKKAETPSLIYIPGLVYAASSRDGIFKPPESAIVVSISSDLESAETQLEDLEGAGYSGGIYKMLDGFYAVAGPYSEPSEALSAL